MTQFDLFGDPIPEVTDVSIRPAEPSDEGEQPSLFGEAS